jgi:hypothetical protein
MSSEKSQITHLLEEVLNDELTEEVVKSLSERIKYSVDNTYDYKKFKDNKGKKITGTHLNIAEFVNLCIIDFDFNKSLTDEQKGIIREDIISKFDKSVVGIVETAHGGLHIYTNLGATKFNVNSNVKIIETEDFSIDVFCSGNSDKRFIVLPESKIKDYDKTKTLIYKNIGVPFDKLFQLITCSEVFDLLGIDIEEIILNKNEVKLCIVGRNNKKFDITKEQAELLINGLKGFEIHNDSGNIPITKELTILPLFSALNSLEGVVEDLDDVYETVKKNNKLTQKALQNWDKKKDKYYVKTSNPFILQKIIRIYNPTYYKEVLNKLIKLNTDWPTFDKICTNLNEKELN